MDHIITVKHLDAQFIFNNAQVLVKGTEHADDMLHPFDFYGFVYHLFTLFINFVLLVIFLARGFASVFFILSCNFC